MIALDKSLGLCTYRCILMPACIVQPTGYGLACASHVNDEKGNVRVCQCAMGTVAVTRTPLIRKKGLEVWCDTQRNKMSLAVPEGKVHITHIRLL